MKSKSGSSGDSRTPPVFLLSPARCDGRRAAVLMNESATFDLAVRLRESGAPIGEVFSFLSGLYFRGKLAYARAFSDSSADPPGILVVTTDRGLVAPGHVVTLEDLRRFATVDLASAGDAFRTPFERDARALDARIPRDRCVVLLGSIATGKYVDCLLEIFGDRLRFPSEFVGRGDMSRGGLLLRQVDSGRELDYIPVAGAIRRGKRPPKLPAR